MTVNIKIRLDDRWGIIGATGAGKTHLSKRLLWAYGRGVQGGLPIWILDTKGYKLAERGRDDFKEFRHPDFGQLIRGQTPPKIEVPKKGRPFVIWQPEYDDIDLYEYFFSQIYHAGIPGLIFVDELSSLTNTTATKFPRHYDILLRQGRGMDIAMVNLTQSPAYIPFNLLRQATHMLRFRLNDDYDVAKIARKMGRAVEAEPEHDYGFWYRNVTRPVKKNPPVYYSDMKEFFGDE